PLAPHTMYVAALWAVLTRMKRPDATKYDDSIQDIISQLTPLEKADLYARGQVPEDVGPEQARELKSAIADLREEDAGTSEYEGRRGASPREMKMILLNASQNDSFPTLSPLAVFEELSELIKDPSVFPFLQQDPDGPYHRHDDFIDTVRDRYLTIIDSEIRGAMGLVEEGQYEDLFGRYIDHINAWLKGEKVYNEITGQREEPDEELMEDVEETIDLQEDVEEYREDLISSIAAYSIDNPDEEVEYREIFPNIFEAMSESFYEQRQEQIRDIEENMLAYFEGDEQNLSSSEIETVENTIETLREKYGYEDAYTQEAVAFLLSNRYNE
ncbi:MAG: serine protein kinase PrkA, partial [Bradymonadaceae bacterium]